MYGNVAVCIEGNDQKCSVNYIAVADGGSTVSQGEKEYEGINVAELINKLTIAVTAVSEVEDGVTWNLLCSEQEKVIIELEEGSWGRNRLLSLIEIVHSYISDEEPLADLKELASF